MVLADIPIQLGYQIDSNLWQVARKWDMKVLDVREVDGISPLSFLDHIHLNPQGASQFSRTLADRLYESFDDFGLRRLANNR